VAINFPLLAQRESRNLCGESREVSNRILVSIPSGFQLRQFIHSNVLDLLLKRGFQALIVSPNHGGEGFAAQLPQAGVEVSALELTRGSFRWRYWLVRQHLLLKGSKTATLRQKMVDLKHRYPWLGLVTVIGNRILNLLPLLRLLTLRCEGLFLRDKAIESLFESQPVDIILLGTPGYTEQDALLLHAAARRRIPVIAAVMSWDNLSSKGVINPEPERLLVWSDHMRREAMEIHGLPPARIAETGSPLHDAFANSKRFGSRAENFQRLGLDPRRRLIVHGTNHAAFFKDEIEVVKYVARWVEEDSLGIPCQLWIRLHPQAVNGPYRLSAEPYRRLASDLVKVEFPPVRNSNLLWDLPATDLDHLVALLRDADVIINSGSLSIDAAILDRPVICIAYDSSGDVPYDRSVRRYYDYTHMSNVVRAGAVQLAQSSEDLRQKIIEYLKYPDLDRSGRKCIVEQQFGAVDGHSAARIVEEVVNLLSTTRERSVSSEHATHRSPMSPS
jgi:hypothetical protein